VSNIPFILYSSLSNLFFTMTKSELHEQQVESITTDTQPDHAQIMGADLSELHGRAIQQQEHNSSYWQALRSDPWLLFWIGVMLWTMGVRGWENQAGGAVLSIPRFKERFGEPQGNGEYFIATKWQSAINGSGGVAIIGSMLASYLADLVGYKPIIRTLPNLPNLPALPFV
jgi:MFS transporter, SP family, general alpha glucoside:H+ symporter